MISSGFSLRRRCFCLLTQKRERLFRDFSENHALLQPAV
jgi:hypothetical protein